MRFMETAAIVAFAVVTASNAFAAGGILDGKTKTKSQEVIGTAAKGDPKPYMSIVLVRCKQGNCIADFGPKRERNRRVEIINCGVATEAGIVRVGAVALGDVENQVGYFSTVSRAMDGTQETAVLEYRNPVTVPPATRLQVAIAVTGKTAIGQCTASGTID